MTGRKLRVECLKLAVELRLAGATDAELMARAEIFEAWARAGESGETASRKEPGGPAREQPGSAGQRPRPADHRKDDRPRRA